jgi:hypothetical protein
MVSIRQLARDRNTEVDTGVGGRVERVSIEQLGGPLAFARNYVARNKPVIVTGGAIDAWPALAHWSEQYIIQQAERVVQGAGPPLITVALTPHGRADSVVPPPSTAAHNSCSQQPMKSLTGASPACLTSQDAYSCRSSACGVQRWFVTPAEVRMHVPDFFRLLRTSRTDSESDTLGLAYTHGNANQQQKYRIVPYAQFQNSSLTAEWAFLADDVQPGLPWADEVRRCSLVLHGACVGRVIGMASLH